MISILFFASIVLAQDADPALEPPPAEELAPQSEPPAESEAPEPAPVVEAQPPQIAAPTETPLGDGADDEAEDEHEIELHPGLDAIVAYDFRLTDTDDGSQWYHEFDLHRVHAWLGAAYGPLEARVVLETVQSASDGALIGVGGDSVVARFREASIRVEPLAWLAIEAGLVPTLVTPTFEAASDLRALGPTALERYGLLSPADLGAALSVEIPEGYGTVSAGLFNGEGYASREQNRGKNTELAAHVHPFAWNETLEPLGVVLAYRQGSAGAGSAQDDRFVAGLTWEGEWIKAHAAVAYALGVENDGGRDGLLVDAGVWVEPLEWLLFAARGSHFVRNLDGDGDHLTSLLLAAGVRPLEPLDVWLSAERAFAGDAAAAALVGVERWDIRAVAHARFEL
jgi:hypothetical protein